MKHRKHLFSDRRDAAKQLVEVLPMDRIRSEQWEFVAVSRGGLELSDMMNERYDLSIDFLFSETITAPNNSECEVARVSEHEEMVLHEKLIEAFDIKLDYIYGEAHRKYEEKILSMVYRYRHGRQFENVKDKTVLLIDEAAETGLKLLTAIKTVMGMHPRAVYVAVPVLPTDVLESLEPLVDDIFYLHDIEDFVDTGSYYGILEEVSDQEIERMLGDKTCKLK
ncbi:MAG: phosphoribosyltransferase [Campylobacterota bacterium]|nr:phosphoribosyltransferase [Campylobacterota bacterium]